MNTSKKYKGLIWVLNKVSAILPAFFWLFLIFGFDEPSMAISTILAAIIHEAGHIAYLISKKRIRPNIRGVLSGFRIKASTSLSYDEEVGVYRNEGIHDDFDLVLRIRKAGKKVVIKNVVLANFRVGGASNDKALKKCVQRCKDRYACYHNNGYSKLYWIECIAIEVAKYILS